MASSHTKPNTAASPENGKHSKTEHKVVSSPNSESEDTQKQDTSPQTIELVNEIKEVADQLKELNSEPVVEETPSTQPGTPEDAPPLSVVPSPSETMTPSTTPSTITPIVKHSTKLSFLQKLSSIFPNRRTADSKSYTAPARAKTHNMVLRVVTVVGVVLLSLVLITAAAGTYVYFSVKPVLAHAQTTYALAKEAYQLMKTQDLENGSAKLKETKQSLTLTQQSYDKLQWLRYVPVVSNYHEDGDAALKAGMAGVEAGEIMLDAVMPYADVLGFKGQGTFEGGTAEDRIVMMVETLDKVTPKLEEVGNKLLILKSEMAKIDPNDYPKEFRGQQVRSQLINAESLIDEATVALTDARPLVEVLPQLLGYPEGKTYLVMFQNDGELRPTGGFMSAYAVLHLDKGRVKAEKSDDIYGLDKKFTKTIQPPEAITKYLNEKRWYLRNMNFSPDYKIAMDTFGEHYGGLSGEYKVDGIIAIDTEVLRSIVEITGPLEIPGYGTFTVENDKRCNLPQIICELEYIVDKPLATVATNRKSDIMGPMMQTLLKRSMGGGKEQLAKLIPLGFKLMEEKHIIVYFNDEEAQKAAESFNIAGRIADTDGDYLHINNANLGGAKSNFYIDELVEQEIEVADDGTVQKKVSVTYTHNEPMDNCNLEKGDLCLSGIQRNYFRVYVPQGSELIEGLGSETEIVAKEDLGKTYFDGFFTLRPESRVKIMLTYKLPYKVQKGQDYSMLIQKQPGIKSVEYTVKLPGKEEEFVVTKDVKKTWKI